MNRASSYATATLPALIVLFFFVWFANWIPQTRWTPPERHEIRADWTPLQMAKHGQTLVRERGCLACHTIEPASGVVGHGRGPNFANFAQRRAQGVPGGPATLVEYLVQSLYEPGAHLVEGYANIMPVSTRPPARLSYEEVVAVVNYLQSLGGKPSVKVGDIPRPAKEAAPAIGASADEDRAITDPRVLLTQFQCDTCHSLKPKEVLVGPPFDGALLRKAAAKRGMSPEAYVMESIVKPRAVETEEFPKEVMPIDYGERLTAGQLEGLVSYLLAPEARK